MINPITLVVEILKAALDVPVSTEIPADRATRLVTVALDGDESDEFVLRPRVTLTCWGLTDKDAQQIAVSCVDALREESLDHPYLSSADLETMSRDLWTKTGQSRYLVEMNLTINVE